MKVIEEIISTGRQGSDAHASFGAGLNDLLERRSVHFEFIGLVVVVGQDERLGRRTCSSAGADL